MLFSDSVDDDNNYNDADSYNNISDNNVGDNDMNNNNSFRKYSLSYQVSCSDSKDLYE